MLQNRMLDDRRRIEKKASFKAREVEKVKDEMNSEIAYY
jgi:hypothetical protein